MKWVYLKIDILFKLKAGEKDLGNKIKYPKNLYSVFKGK